MPTIVVYSREIGCKKKIRKIRTLIRKTFFNIYFPIRPTEMPTEDLSPNNTILNGIIIRKIKKICTIQATFKHKTIYRVYTLYIVVNWKICGIFTSLKKKKKKPFKLFKQHLGFELAISSPCILTAEQLFNYTYTKQKQKNRKPKQHITGAFFCGYVFC